MTSQLKLLAFFLITIASAALIAGTAWRAPVLASAPSQQTQARSLSSAQLNLLLQGSFNDTVQCHNQRSFCRADVARCKNNQRERMNWRRSCRADYEAAFRKCSRESKKALPRSNLNNRTSPEQRAKMLRDHYERICGHTRRGAGRCEIEIASCPAPSVCRTQYSSCLSGSLPKQEGYVREDTQPNITSPAPPKRLQPESVREPAGKYLVSIKNQCREAISVAYVYDDPSGETMKSGWLTIKPSEKTRIKKPVSKNQLGVHSTVGFPRPTYRFGQDDVANVVNRGFTEPVYKVLSGDGAREVPFELLEWPKNDRSPVIQIDYCGSYRWGKRINPVALKPALKIDPVQAAANQLYRYARIGSVKGFDRLVADGVDPKRRYKKGNTLFHAAAAAPISVIEFDIAMLRRLENAGIDPMATNANGSTPLELAIARRIDFMDYNQFDHFAPKEPYRNDILHFFVDRTETLPVAGSDGRLTLLHVAALDYDAEMVRKLIARGPSTGRMDGKGMLPRDYARKKSPEFYALFLSEEELATKRAAANAPSPELLEASCQRADPAKLGELELARLKAMAAQGLIKLCGI